MPHGETEPLLPRYEEETPLRRRLHQKLHSYQMLHALSEGYMPSTDQLIANLSSLLASDIFNPRTQEIGTVGRQLIRDCRLCLQVFIDFLRDKNSDDQLQDFLWHLSRSRASLRPSHISQHASQVKARADSKAAYDSLRTVGQLLLTNADFRLFVDDLTTIGRRIFSDTTVTLSATSQEAGEQLKPSAEDVHEVNGASADEDRAPSNEELRQEITDVAESAGNEMAHTGREAVESVKEHLGGQQGETLFYRLKQSILKLRERPDYSNSVATLAQLVRRYATIYANATPDIAAAAEDIDNNADLKEAMQKLWALLQSFGDPMEWSILEQNFRQLLRHANNDPEFERLMSEIGSSIQEMLTSPDFFDSAPEKIKELETKSKQVDVGSNLRQDVDAFLVQAKRAIWTVPEDSAVSKLIDATEKTYRNAWVGYYDQKERLPLDLLEVLFPLFLRCIHYIPIPRLEISAPELDLLLENLILEPGHAAQFSSFLPCRIHITTRNDIDIIKRHSKRTETDLKTTFTATIMGLNISASEFGYWLRTHSGPFCLFKDEGIASFFLDRRGIDIILDVEVGRDRLEQIFTLRGVRVVIHKLDYQVHSSKWRFLLWLMKPLLKHLLRRVVEKKIAEQIVQVAFALNRELVFARERLHAVRIANPHDLVSFVHAILARLSPTSSLSTRIGIDVPGKSVFKGVYAPESLVKVWHEEAIRAQEAIEEGDESHRLIHTWRNDIFDVPTSRSHLGR
ncbi:hypothetical protein EYZ11_008677 [Aspergillus tanneri]|uniref:HAM1-like N-terminal domain-containing protein n=1 Tax=Aspergillus tanneri TaxID=1220188 RepID=A0A4S3JA94_9EURO|nr:uncharacterized protein ATNIH1004_001250 [Aspergillus tanneri]KAA8652346.1 hypothetical protein ATNIH1004_001250 [Aspergillus tanneri]THC91855.1 hypothetical protein EYZ11_008677 [Aspergillus tanneri]